MPAPAMNSRLASILLAIFCMGVSGVAGAVSCSVSATTTSFGSYNPLSPANTDGTGTVTVTCNNIISLLVSYDILLSKGGSGNYASRSMTSGSSTLNYNLYTSILRTTIWGDGTGGSGKISDGYLLGVLIPTVKNYTVYGRIPAQQNVAPGSYVDSITVTVNY